MLSPQNLRVDKKVPPELSKFVTGHRGRKRRETTPGASNASSYRTYGIDCSEYCVPIHWWSSSVPISPLTQSTVSQSGSKFR